MNIKKACISILFALQFSLFNINNTGASVSFSYGDSGISNYSLSPVGTQISNQKVINETSNIEYKFKPGNRATFLGINGNADSPIISNGFLIYKNITRGNKLYTIDLTASCVGTYPVGSQLSNTTPPSVTQYQNSNSGGYCYYQIPTTCINPILNSNPLTNTGGFHGNVNIQNTNSSGTCYASYLTGYKGASCNQFSEPFENNQEIRSNNIFSTYWFQFNGNLNRITGNTVTSLWDSGIYNSPNNVMNQPMQIYRITNKGNVAYALFQNGVLKELSLEDGRTLREINLNSFVSGGFIAVSYSFPFIISSDDKRLYWISYENGFYYINKFDLSTFSNQKYIKSANSIYGVKESKDGNYLFYNTSSFYLYKKYILNTDVNDLGSQFLNYSYLSYQINFSADGNSLLFSNGTSIYKKALTDNNSSNIDKHLVK